MSAAEWQPTAADFGKAEPQSDAQRIVRPPISYWQDAWQRLRRNPRALLSLGIVVALVLFAIAGPWVWRVNPAQQDLDQISRSPSLRASARIAAPYAGWPGVTVDELPAQGSAIAMNLRLAEPANTQIVRIVWDAAVGATGYHVYRNVSNPRPGRALGLPLGEIVDPHRVSYEDRFDLDAVKYWYSVVALDANGVEADDYASFTVEPTRMITAEEAADHGLVASAESAQVGDTVTLPAHPLGTDYLGRDLLSRLMHGGRVSLFIGVVAPFLFVLFGIVYGSTAGFAGGRLDQVLMRLADFVVALPFLLFMILFRIAFGIGPGESGVFPMLVALVLLSWPSTARLVRGQVLQIRNEAYIAASRLLGAKTWYLVFRHMIPNTIGVILVTLTFEVPRVIFIEAFLSFIGMGVAPPTPSWGSMSNEGIKTMLSHPHELLFPAIFISVAVLAFNLLGDGLRDALDVRLRGRE